ncbi:MAG TPA: ornithine cyclodeaminase family protein [Steroidobacteraceae bacterium]|nr:ornithine cyclodeaminase family protein [Steroidobacteraceae bacterium]
MSGSSSQRSLLVVGPAEVHHALPMADCIELMAQTMASVSRGDALIPLRTVMPLPGGNLFGAMPGHLARPQALGAKLICIFPDNAHRGLPSHCGLVVVFDPETGLPRAVIDAAAVTAVRTAAASGVATRALAKQDAAHLGILGAGEQATTHLEAMANVRRLRSVRLWARDAAKARAFAEREGARLGVAIGVCASARDAVADADIVCTVTGAHEPVLQGSWLRPGAHVNLVGASRATTREADDDVVARARFFVDLRASARAEAGELLHAIQAGRVEPKHIAGEIGEVLNGTVQGRTREDEITVYKSLGIAAQDLAAAELICARATSESIGTRVPF